jgi:hypothetical protein
MSYDVEISTSVSVRQCLYAIGEKRREWKNKNYIYPSGDAGVSFRGCNINFHI